MTPLGCMGVAVGMLAFVAIVAALSGYFFYLNFGPALRMARDQIEPVGQEFVRDVCTGSLASAYAALTDDSKEHWTQPKFAELADTIKRQFGPLRTVQTDVLYDTIEEIRKDEDQKFDKLPMSFDAVFDEGTVNFRLMFRLVEPETDDSKAVWRISGLEVEYPEEKTKQ